MLWRRGKAYGQDLRERVFAAFDGGVPVGQVAAMLLVSVSYVSKVLSRRRLTGETTARPQRCHVPRKLTAHEAQIRTQMAARPDATLAELQAWLLSTHQVCASSALLSSTLRRLGLTLKKRPCMPPNKTAPMSHRHAWHGAMARSGWMPGR
jgi:transposase